MNGRGGDTGSGPTVTVLMAVHNGELHLPESLASLLSQTYGDWELVLVDDGSTDSTFSIMERCRDARIRVFRNPENIGLVRSLNRGLAEARGRYIARQDADDVSEPPRLEQQVVFLEAHPQVALVASDYLRTDDEGGVIGERHVPRDATSIRWRLLFLNAFAHSSVMFRRDVVEMLGGYNEGFPFAEDYDLWSRIAWSADVAAIREPLVRYRQSAASMTATVEASAVCIDTISRDNIRRLGRGAERLAETINREDALRVLLKRGAGLERRRRWMVSRQLLVLESLFARHEKLVWWARLARRAVLVKQIVWALTLREADRH